MPQRLTDLPIEAILGSKHVCSCGKTHVINTQKIVVERDAEQRILPVIKELSLPDRVFMVSDENTYAAAGKQAADILRANGALAGELRLTGTLHADEAALGAVLTHLPDDTSNLTMLSVGGGTLSDITRYTAFRAGLPFMLYGTAPSMDGYASSNSPLISDGFKRTFNAKAPAAIFANPRVLANAPQKLIAAGLGDILGKYTALADWHLANDVRGEYICPEIIEMVYRAVTLCAGCVDALYNRDEDAAKVLFEALTLTGFAIQMAEVSRPASGSEHKISHFLEMLDMNRGRAGTLHGDKVGMATIVVIDLYARMFEQKTQPQPMVPHEEWLGGIRNCFGPLASQMEEDHAQTMQTPEEVRAENSLIMETWGAHAGRAKELEAVRGGVIEQLERLGGPVHPSDLGYSKEDLYLAIMYAKDVRPRYTLLNAADNFGVLKKIAREVADAYYPER